jgi:mRNA-degrading endonuclease RelE of RelBE toxin-antitoxin system
MTYTLIWRNEARQTLSRLRSADPTSAKLIIAAVRDLATNPYPDASSQLGQSTFRRIKLRDLRITYDVSPENQSVQIYHVGQLPPTRHR